jgi:diguanylate cyclase (GGDEF)-like protein
MSLENSAVNDPTRLPPDEIQRRLSRLAELESEVAERTAELAWANERLVAELYERNAAEADAQQALKYDRATGLPNRVLFESQMDRAIAGHLETGEPAAIVIVGIERLAAVRESLGFEAGDQAARLIGERLKMTVRGSDLVARIGDDEFALMLLHLRASQDAETVARKMIEHIDAPMRVAGRGLRLQASIGIALCPEDGAQPDTLLSRAQAAMRFARQSGTRLYQFFNPAIGQHNTRRLRLESELRHALDNHEFRVHFQPRVNLRTRRVVGVEALLRWEHPARGLLPAGEFIDVADATGLIVPIGEAALRAACASATAWPGSIGVAVNLSPREFRGSNLESIVDRALLDSGLDPKRLQVEMVEASLGRSADEIDAAAARLSMLRDRGVKIALDDFGTGACSLSLLRTCPVDYLKIEGRLIRRLADDADSMAVVRAIASLGRHFKARVVAEGIETEAQLERARRAGCAEGQGYLLSRPMPEQELAELLRAAGGVTGGRGRVH